MKKILLAGAALVALTVSASAADLPRRNVVTAPAYIPPVFSWTGFYAGLNAGYAFNGDSNLTDPTLNGVAFNAANFTGTRRNSDDGSFTGGAQLGYNYQIGSVVLGIETDLNYANIDKNYYASNDFALIGARSQTQWYGTLRPRIGFTPMDRLLVYVTGGLAYGQVKSSAAYADFNGFALSGSKTDTRVGWTLGAGVEYAVTNNITVRGEYAYVDLGDKNHNAIDGVGNVLSWKDPTNFHVVRAGVNYKF